MLTPAHVAGMRHRLDLMRKRLEDPAATEAYGGRALVENDIRKLEWLLRQFHPDGSRISEEHT